MHSFLKKKTYRMMAAGLMSFMMISQCVTTVYAETVVISDEGPLGDGSGSVSTETTASGTQAGTNAGTVSVQESSVAQNGMPQAPTTVIEDTGSSTTAQAETTAAAQSQAVATVTPAQAVSGDSLPLKTAETVALGDLVDSAYGTLFDLDTNKMVAEKNSDAVINPASMTKVLTLLIVCERVQNLDEKLTITQSIINYVNDNDCSNAGLSAGETVSVRDLLYGLILPSGADAALALTNHVACSQENFTALMNQKARELGLSSGAHFTNCVGLYDADHHCTVRDIAIIMKAALSNQLAATVLTTPTYKITTASKHTNGKSLTNLFVSRISDKDTHGTVAAAKTGYVSKSGYCAVSYLVGNNGRHYICVTGKASSTWKAIYDHVAIYQNYVK